MLNYVTVVAMTEDLNHVVLLKKLKGPEHIVGKWTFPGGKAEEGESMEATAAREFQEETGVWIDRDNLIPIYKRTAADYAITAFAVKGAVSGAKTVEEEEVVVVTLGEAVALSETGNVVPEFSQWLLDAMKVLGEGLVFSPQNKASMNELDLMPRIGSEGPYLPGMFMTIIGYEEPETGANIGKVVRITDCGGHYKSPTKAAYFLEDVPGRTGFYYEVEAPSGLECLTEDGKSAEAHGPSNGWAVHVDDMRPSTEDELADAWGDFRDWTASQSDGRLVEENLLLKMHIARVSAELAYLKPRSAK